jgi:hypothetical protein
LAANNRHIRILHTSPSSSASLPHHHQWRPPWPAAWSRGCATRRHGSRPGRRSRRRGGRGLRLGRPLGPGPGASRTACSARRSSDAAASSASSAAPSASTPSLSSRSCSAPWSSLSASTRFVPAFAAASSRVSVHLIRSVPGGLVCLSSHFRVLVTSESEGHHYKGCVWPELTFVQ